MLNNSFHDDDKQQAGLALDREPNAVATLCLAKATAEPPPRSSVSSRNASENRAAGASRQATDIRGQADHMPGPSWNVGACVMASSG